MKKLDTIFAIGFITCHLVMVFQMDGKEIALYDLISFMFALVGYISLFRVILSKDKKKKKGVPRMENPPPPPPCRTILHKNNK